MEPDDECITEGQWSIEEGTRTGIYRAYSVKDLTESYEVEKGGRTISIYRQIWKNGTSRFVVSDPSHNDDWVVYAASNAQDKKTLVLQEGDKAKIAPLAPMLNIHIPPDYPH